MKRKLMFIAPLVVAIVFGASFLIRSFTASALSPIPTTNVNGASISLTSTAQYNPATGAVYAPIVEFLGNLGITMRYEDAQDRYTGSENLGSPETGLFGTRFNSTMSASFMVIPILAIVVLLTKRHFSRSRIKPQIDYERTE